jgi:hypothetical protein
MLDVLRQIDEGASTRTGGQAKVAVIAVCIPLIQTQDRDIASGAKNVWPTKTYCRSEEFRF